MTEGQTAETPIVSEKSERKGKVTFGGKALVNALLTGTALSTILTACGGLTPEEKQSIPEVSLHELIANPDLYTSLPYVKTVGYPEETGKRTIRIPIIYNYKIGKIPIYRIDWIVKETDTYQLHEEPNSDSPSI